MSTGEWHPAFEEYCETIYELAEEGVRVVQARISERLDVSRPSVSGMVKRLSADGLVELNGPEIALTDSGLELAEQVVRRHRLAERFLCDVLGLPWAQAHHEAGKWEHVIGDDVEGALIRVLGEPTTCPHGNPIPGSDYADVEMLALGELDEGVEFVVERIPEELEFADGMLEFLERCGILPGVAGRIHTRGIGTVQIEVTGALLAVDDYVASRLLVSI